MDYPGALKTGFRVHYFRDLANPGTVDLRTVRMDASVPFAAKETCPACDERMEVFCTFIAKRDRRRMRIGRCHSCGSFGYIDRPTESWISSYYLNEWDNAVVRDIEKEVREYQHGVTGEQRDAVQLARHFTIGKERPVCDIGCGKGAVLREFELLGFRNLIGVEPSSYRASVVHKIYGYPVFVGNFESEMIGHLLKAQSPIGIFFSHHVLEHVYHPFDFLKRAASLQEEGDYIILSMPDVIHEPSVITLFWLPHLNGFTAEGLEKLMNHAGYEVVADNFSYKRLMMAGRRTKTPKTRGRYSAGSTHLDADRILSWFSVGSLTSGRRYRVIWTSKSYHVSWKPVSRFAELDAMHRFGERTYDYVATRVFGKFRNQRSVVVGALEHRYTDARESPLEVQFDGDIELLLR